MNTPRFRKDVPDTPEQSPTGGDFHEKAGALNEGRIPRPMEERDSGRIPDLNREEQGLASLGTQDDVIQDDKRTWPGHMGEPQPSDWPPHGERSERPPWVLEEVPDFRTPEMSTDLPAPVEGKTDGSTYWNKREFDPQIREGLNTAGFETFWEDDYVGRSKPDYLMTKDGDTYVGETKSPAECRSNSWLHPVPGDSETLRSAREHANERIAEGLPKEVAQHEVIIGGQVPDYAEKLSNGEVRDLPEGVSGEGALKGAYSVPASEANNVEAAFADMDTECVKIEHGNGTVTYTWDLD